MTGSRTAPDGPATELSAHRPMLFGLAYRLLGSVHDAEDVLQEAYLRWAGVDHHRVADPGRYLARTVTRLAYDTLRARRSRRESYPGTWLPEPLPTPASPSPATDPGTDPAEQVAARETLSFGLLHLLERLAPPERAVFVLRTAFGWRFGEIGEALELRADHCRQLFRRAVKALDPAGSSRRFTVDAAVHERLLTRFVTAARHGDVGALTELLRQDVVAWSDGGGRVRSARHPIRGAAKVARYFVGISHRRHILAVTPRTLNGGPAVVVTRPDLMYALLLAVTGGRISDIYVVANPAKLAALTGPPPVGWGGADRQPSSGNQSAISRLAVSGESEA